LDEVTIWRDGDSAVIEFADENVGTVYLRLGPEVQQMSDIEILEKHNQVVEAQNELLHQYDNTVIEIPVGKPQIQHYEGSDQWMARGDVLRCIIEDDEDRRPVIWIDDREFSWQEFGRMIVSYAGWGMRIAFVPEECIADIPDHDVREPRKDEQ
jgi:hypothetical protein